MTSTAFVQQARLTLSLGYLQASNNHQSGASALRGFQPQLDRNSAHASVKILQPNALPAPSTLVAMVGSSHPTWHPLPVSHKGIPSLLVSTSFTPTPASYTVHITDLANIWVEDLDRRGIIRRSLDENTTIDPSEDADNMRAFLDKLQAAFQQDHDDHDSTSLSLSISDKEDAGLLIRITCILPGNLKPLKWPMHLKRCLPSSVATELVLPLIQAQQTRAREVDALKDALRDKDTVITKLVDKLEASGTGLEHVFNSLSGRRKVTRSLAEDRVKGLAPFKETDFRASFGREDAEARDGTLTDLIQTVFGGAGLRYRTDVDFCDSPQLNDWWTKLGTGPKDSVPLIGKKKDVAKKAITPPPPSKPVDDDDEFQVQSTPPHLMSAKRKSPTPRPNVPGDDDTTDDDDTSQIPDSNPPPRTSQAAQAPSSKPSRLGTIRGKRKPETPPEPPAPSSPVTHAHGDNDDDVTASETDDELDVPPPAPKPTGQVRKGGLGRIGGKPKAETAAPVISASPQVEDSTQPLKPTKGKLGHIGKKAALAERPQSHADSGDDDRGRPSTKAEIVEEKPRETSEERADRKRTELQKELERKAAAGPAKKKRKF